MPWIFDVSNEAYWLLNQGYYHDHGTVDVSSLGDDFENRCYGAGHFKW